jgi:predicted nucleic acid-binding protein
MRMPDDVVERPGRLAARDGTSVALAEAFRCSLVTAEGRLGRAPRIGCPVTVVPR